MSRRIKRREVLIGLSTATLAGCSAASLSGMLGKQLVARQLDGPNIPIPPPPTPSPTFLPPSYTYTSTTALLKAYQRTANIDRVNGIEIGSDSSNNTLKITTATDVNNVLTGSLTIGSLKSNFTMPALSSIPLDQDYYVTPKWRVHVNSSAQEIAPIFGGIVKAA